MSEEKRLEILYDHYKDSFTYIQEYLKRREKLFIFILVVISLQFLQIYSSEQSVGALNAFLEKQFNFSFILSKEFVSILLWFFLFSISLRYFQINILISRQYNYVHSIEDKLCLKSEDKNFISREGREYLKNYAYLSNWAHIIYTWVFPILLLLVAFIKIILSIIIRESPYWNLVISGIFFIAICITTILYLIDIHPKNLPPTERSSGER